jgi:hypothetical protein
MNNSIEKSCWGITLWAIAIVLGVVFISSFVMRSKQVVAGETISSPVLSTASTTSN